MHGQAQVAAVTAIAARHVPETRDPSVRGRFDVAGAVLAALALAGITDALIGASGHGPLQPVLTGVAGALALAGFILLERRRGRTPHRVPPMLPLGVFASRQFSAVNVITFLVYGALGGTLFLLVLQLQVVSGFSPLAAGVSLLPSTLAMLALSSRAGALAARFGPRWLMTGGPLVTAAGLLLATRIGPSTSYVADVLPAVAVQRLPALARPPQGRLARYEPSSPPPAGPAGGRGPPASVMLAWRGLAFLLTVRKRASLVTGAGFLRKRGATCPEASAARALAGDLSVPRTQSMAFDQHFDVRSPKRRRSGSDALVPLPSVLQRPPGHPPRRSQ